MNLGKGIELTYMGNSTVKIKSPEGKILIVDPWIDSNPTCPEGLKKIDHVDILAITNAHFDHIRDSVSIGNKHQPKVVGVYETCLWLNGKDVRNILPMNKGDTQEIDGIKFTMVHADQSCVIQEDDGTITYGGEAVGYVIEFENGFKVYHAGDTAIFSDMELIAKLYSPELVMLPIGDLFTMSTEDAARACEFLSPKYVIPMHYGTFPLLTGAPDELRTLTKDIKDIEILELKPGETIT